MSSVIGLNLWRFIEATQAQGGLKRVQFSDVLKFTEEEHTIRNQKSEAWDKKKKKNDTVTELQNARVGYRTQVGCAGTVNNIISQGHMKKALLRVWWEQNAQREEAFHTDLLRFAYFSLSMVIGTAFKYTESEKQTMFTLYVWAHLIKHHRCLSAAINTCRSASTSFTTVKLRSDIHNPWNRLQSLRDLERELCNFPWFNWVIYIWGIYILIRPSVPQQSHWLTLSLDDILWTHYEQRGCERLAWALLREHSPVSISQWYCIWVTAGSFCLSNLSLQLCWNRQHASLISHAVSMGKWSLGVLDQCCRPLFTLLLRRA